MQSALHPQGALEIAQSWFNADINHFHHPQADNEIGIDCGLAACGKQCDWNGGRGSVANDGACDANVDCKSKHCDLTDEDNGVCSDAIFSCHNVKQFDADAKDG